MKNLDRISFMVLFLFGLGWCLKSLTYPIGSLRTPGAGLFPLVASILLMFASAYSVVESFLRKIESEEGPRASFFPEKEAPKRILVSFVLLIAFRYLFPLLGFAPSAFCFIFCLARLLGHFRWRASLFFAGSAATGAYILFQSLLKIQVPRGIFGI
jgi:hypothetical protein